MPRQACLHFQVLTPRAAAFEGDIDGARVPTETGQVGLRPGGEALVLAVEPGLVALRAGGRTQLVATAGGLLESGPWQVTLYTPFAAVGDTAPALEAALDAALTDPDSELAARQRLGELEQAILREVSGRTPPGASAGGGHHGG